MAVVKADVEEETVDVVVSRKPEAFNAVKLDENIEVVSPDKIEVG